MSHENSNEMNGRLPEEPRLPILFHQSEYSDVEPGSRNVRTSMPVSCHIRSTNGHLITSGTTPLGPYRPIMRSVLIKPKAMYIGYANSQTVGGLSLKHTHHHHVTTQKSVHLHHEQHLLYPHSPTILQSLHYTVSQKTTLMLHTIPSMHITDFGNYWRRCC